MTVAVVELDSLELPEETLDLLTEDAFDHEETLAERITHVLVSYYKDGV